jgi:DNA-binding CsgD family transcriptional regulator
VPTPTQPLPAGPGDAGFIGSLAPYLPPALTKLTVPCYILDRSGRIRWLNAAAKELLGDVTGRLQTSLVKADLAPMGRRRLADQLRGEQQPDITVDLRGRDGRECRVQISSVPLEAGDRAIGVFGLATPKSGTRAPATVPHRLTQRQLDVLHRLGQGASTEQIAADLHLSRETVRNHVRHLLERLGARSRLEAVAIAHRDGLL